MTDLTAIIQNENGNIKLEMIGEGLFIFSDQPVSRAKHKLSTAIAEAREGKYLIKEEVKEMRDVYDATLWHQAKKNYPKPVRVGSKARYQQSGIQKVLDERNPSI